MGIMEAVGHPIKVTDDYRSIDEQNELYAQGRTKPGKIVTNAKGGESFHNWRCAFDVVFVAGNTVTYEGPWDTVGKVGEILGLEWGGRWTSFQDRPHFQFTAGYSLEDFQKGRVDERKFGEESDTIKGTFYKAITNITMTKRIKSFLISAASILGTAMVAIVLTPEWATFVTDVYAWLGALGWPASIVAVVGLLVAELWKQYLNHRKMQAYEKEYGTVGVYRAQRDKLDLY